MIDGRRRAQTVRLIRSESMGKQPARVAPYGPRPLPGLPPAFITRRTGATFVLPENKTPAFTGVKP